MQHHTADKLQRLGQIPVLKHENDSQLVILFVYLCFLSSWHVFLSHYVNSMENMKKKTCSMIICFKFLPCIFFKSLHEYCVKYSFPLETKGPSFKRSQFPVHP